MKTFDEIYKICEEICKNYNNNRKQGFFFKKVIFNDNKHHIGFYVNEKRNILYFAKGSTSYSGMGEDYTHVNEKFNITLTQKQKKLLINLWEKNYKSKGNVKEIV
jgi:hypothetical protein